MAARELAVIRLEDDEGRVGWGEAAPLEPYDGVSLEEVIESLREALPRGSAPQARAAWELAELDLQMRRRGKPLAEPGADAMPVNCTLPAGPPEEVAAAAAAGLRQGFSCFKVKVGLPDDGERVAAVREAVGSWPALRVDANGAWQPAQAMEAIAALERYDLELVEQPCPTLADLAEVSRHVSVPVAADESIASPKDVRGGGGAGRLRRGEREAGGKRGLRPGPRRVAGRARGRPAGMALQHARRSLGHRRRPPAASSEHVSLACGLATLGLFDAEIARALPAPSAGLLAVPHGPGLGIEVSDRALAEVLVEEVG